MKRLSLLALLMLGSLLGQGGAQELPELTQARQKAVNDLVQACATAGAVTVEGKGAAMVVRFDQKKVRAVVAARRGQLNSDLVDGLVVLWFRAHPAFNPLQVAMLRAYGAEKKDDRARGFAAFLAATGDRNALRLPAAARAYREAAAYFARVRDTAWQAASLNNAGDVLKNQGEYDEALKHYRQALELWQTLFPPQKYKHGHLYLAYGLNNVGFALKEQGKYEEALKYLSRALKMLQTLHPREKHPHGHPLVAQSLNNVGMVLQAQGKYELALEHHRQALRMLEALYPREQHKQGHPLLAQALVNLGSVRKAQGEYDEALGHYRQALLIYQALYPREKYRQGHPQLATSLNNLGSVLEAQGEHAEALKYYRLALQMRQNLYPRKQFEQGHPELATSLNNLGNVLRAQGEYEDALKYYRQSLRMLQALFPRDRYRQGHPLLASSLNNVGAVLYDLGEYEQALEHYRLALQLTEALYPRAKYERGHPHLAQCLNNVGAALQALGEYPAALKHLRQALEMRQTLYPSEKYRQGHPDLAQSLTNVGGVLQARGDYQEAIAYFRQALRMNQALYPEQKYRQGHPVLAGSLFNLGMVLRAQGGAEEALPLLRRALQMYQLEAEALAASAPEDRALNFAASLPLARDGFLSCAAQLKGSAASTYAAIWPTRSAVTRIHERRHLALLAAGGSARVKPLYDHLLSLRQQRARVLLAPLPADQATRDQRLKSLRQEIEKAEEELLPLLPALARSRQLARSTPGQLQQALGREKGTAFVDLLRYVHIEQDPRVKGQKGLRRTPRYTAFVLTPDRLAWLDLGKAKPIEEALESWRRALSRGSDAAPRWAGRVRELTWDRLAEALKGIDTIYLAPDARLTQLPWAALPGDRPGTVLLEQVPLAVVPHGVFLLDRLTAPGQEVGGKPVLLAVGGVRYDEPPREGNSSLPAKPDRASGVSGRQGPKWPYLTGTREELRHLTGLAGGLTVRTLDGAEASTQRLLAELPLANLAHLATHGFFADARFRSVLQLDEKLFERVTFRWSDRVRRIGAGSRNPLVLSGLVLAGANRADTADRGILSADDLVRLDLRRLELAVLSACETGLGETGGGEGVFGLQRAFHIAGCRNVIASLWKVDDQATSALMTLFYRFLWEEKLPAIQALRKAQLALYHNPDRIKAWSAAGRGLKLKEVVSGGTARPFAEVKPTRKAHPRLWAAFSLSGLGR
jgi:tetratricopeptide (TPR) repeat protein